MNIVNKILILIILLQPLIGFLSYSMISIPPAVISFIFVAPLLFIIFIRKRRISVPTYIWVFTLFIFFELISKYVINGVNFKVDVNFRETLLFVSTLLIVLYIENAQFKKRDLKYLFTTFYLLCIVALIVSVIQYFDTTFYINSENIESQASNYLNADNPERRIPSIFSWVDNMNLMVFGIPISLNIYLANKIKSKGNLDLASFFLIGIVGLLCILSKSRNFLMMYTIVVLYYLYISVDFKLFLKLVFGFGLVAMGIVLLNFDFSSYVEDRLLSESYMTRIQAIFVFIEVFPNNFLWGTGGQVTEQLQLAYGRETRIHNGYLGLLFYYGIVGGITFFYFILKFYKRYSKRFLNCKINYVFISFLCLAMGNLAVDYYHLFDFGIFATLIYARHNSLT